MDRFWIVTVSIEKKKVDEHIQKGIEFHELGQLEKATHYFRLAAREGCPIGMFLYGISLRHGWGCKINTSLAFQYLETSAKYAVNRLSTENEYSLTSKGELIMAIYELGVSFQQGWGVSKDKETAFYYFNLAASLGDVDAMNDIAFCYSHGHGIKKNTYKAAQYYRMASRHGQEQIANSWIWKNKYNVVDEPGWDTKYYP
ncbi:hypothetical protein BDB01DRAFT_841631 [Pilobolus umbonatus]|nr:hypothetical protein BDB01DRAFT_841631 [Pilobolus umbonatus]